MVYCGYTYHVHFPLLQYPNADTVAKHIVAVIKTFRDLKPSVKEYGRMSWNLFCDWVSTHTALLGYAYHCTPQYAFHFTNTVFHQSNAILIYWKCWM